MRPGSGEQGELLAEHKEEEKESGTYGTSPFLSFSSSLCLSVSSVLIA